MPLFWTRRVCPLCVWVGEMRLFLVHGKIRRASTSDDDLMTSIEQGGLAFATQPATKPPPGKIRPPFTCQTCPGRCTAHASTGKCRVGFVREHFHNSSPTSTPSPSFSRLLCFLVLTHHSTHTQPHKHRTLRAPRQQAASMWRMAFGGGGG